MTASHPGTGEAPTYVVRLPGRILVSGLVEQGCVLETVQGRQATFRTTDPGVEGSRGTAVAYVDLIGRLEGPLVRTAPDRVSLTITVPDAKWARLRQQLALIADMPADERDEPRLHHRIVPDITDVRLLLPHDVAAIGRIRDVSRSGAAIESRAAVSVGDRVTVGATRGTVARLFEGGFGVQFVRLLPLEGFGADLRL